MPLPQFEVGRTTIGQLVDIVAEQFGEKHSVVYHEIGIRHNYSEFCDICNDVPRSFMALGIEKGYCKIQKYKLREQAITALNREGAAAVKTA